MPIITNNEINELLDKIDKIFIEFEQKHPIDKISLPGWLCIDVGLSDYHNVYKERIKDVYNHAIHPAAIKYKFEGQLLSLMEEEHKEEDVYNHAIHEEGEKDDTIQRN